MRRPGYLSDYSCFGEDAKLTGKAALQAELAKLQAQEAATAATPLEVPQLTPVAYTGGGGGGIPTRAAPKILTPEEKLEQLVSDWETQQAMKRAFKPAPEIKIPTQATAAPPTAAPPASVEAPPVDTEASPEAEPEAGMEEKPGKKIKKWFANLSYKLFGAPDEPIELAGDDDSSTIKTLIPIIIAIAVIGLLRKKK